MGNEEKTLLAMEVIQGYPELSKVLGHEEAAREMGHLLGERVLRGEINQFEADLIGTVAILGSVATYTLQENERLRDGQQA